VIESEFGVIVPVYEPPAQVDATNIAGFSSSIGRVAARFGAVIVDCSSVVALGPSGMRVLRIASRSATVTLVNPNPGLQLMAAAYGFEVQHAHDRVPQVQAKDRLMSVKQTTHPSTARTF
jgi:anti-anti-sigma regulatory factor